MNRQPEGFTAEDYTSTKYEYNPELVKNIETGGYEVISDATFSLLEVDFTLDSGSDHSFSYKIDRKGVEAQREFVRVDSENYDESGFRTTQTSLDISYQLARGSVNCETINIAVGKSMIGQKGSMQTVYCIEHYPRAGRVVAQVTYPDVAYGTYNSRDMTPYDEAQLAKELVLMQDYVDVQKNENDLIDRFA